MAMLVTFALLAGCGSSGGSGGGALSSLAAGSLFGASSEAHKAENKAAAEAPKPMARPVQVGWTVARAERCGFLLDRAKLKRNYLAWEAQKGVTPEELKKIERAYEFSRLLTTARAKKDPNYCTERVLKVVRADLPRMVAGDFDLPPRAKKRGKQSDDSLSFAFTGFKSGAAKKLDREDIFRPKDQVK